MNTRYLELIGIGFAEDDEEFRMLRLPHRDGGYGVVLCITADNRRTHVTAVTDDPDFIRLLSGAAISESDEFGVDLPEDKFPWKFVGWPHEWKGADVDRWDLDG